MAIGEEGRQLGCHDIAVDEPDQEAPVALGQRRPGGDPRPRPDADPAGDGQPGPPFGTGRGSARSESQVVGRWLDVGRMAGSVGGHDGLLRVAAIVGFDLGPAWYERPPSA
jgi:hypothetical protein